MNAVETLSLPETGVTGNILIVDDDREMCSLVERDLQFRGYGATSCTSAERAMHALTSQEFDVVLTDLNMPHINGVELCHRIAANRPDVPVIVITAFGRLETAVEAIRAGAFDFISKPIEMELLEIAVRRAVKHRQLRRKIALLEKNNPSLEFEDMIGSSDAMARLFQQIAAIAETDFSVLFMGESGSGKELAARAVHARSERQNFPFVAINCAALPAALLESELFGHAAGAFTSAHKARKGLVEEADHGTLFLDEIGEMPLELQPKLLRSLEQRTIRPVGSNQEIPVDIRVIAATNKDLKAEVDAKRFREDLYYRLSVIPIDLPPLRSRGSDVLLLAEHFLRQCVATAKRPIVGMTEAFSERLMEYSWPGNVRELRNTIERAVALSQHDKLTVDDLPTAIRAYQKSQLVFDGHNPSDLVSIDEMERRYILHVLNNLNWNRSLAARMLGMDRKTLYRKLRQYGHSEKETEAVTKMSQ